MNDTIDELAGFMGSEYSSAAIAVLSLYCTDADFKRLAPEWFASWLVEDYEAVLCEPHGNCYTIYVQRNDIKPAIFNKLMHDARSVSANVKSATDMTVINTIPELKVGRFLFDSMVTTIPKLRVEDLI